MNTIRVCLFAGAREAVGEDAIEVELPPGATYGDLARRVAAAYPQLAKLVEAGRFAAGAAYTTAGQAVDQRVEIALIPPVSGG